MAEGHKDVTPAQHGHAAVLDLGLAQPVQVDADIVDVGQPQRVETDVTGHGPVQ